MYRGEMSQRRQFHLAIPMLSELSLTSFRFKRGRFGGVSSDNNKQRPQLVSGSNMVLQCR